MMHTMRHVALAVTILLVSVGLAGCADDEPAEGNELPAGWDEEVPEESRLADVPYYTLRASTTFLAKNVSYARYVFHVPEPIDGVAVFFTTTNGFSQAPAPSIDDDEYHYEFMQLRPLGAQVDVVNVDASSEFEQGSTGHVFTLTYLYGKGTDYQYLAPFDGNPYNWTLEEGFYEVVIASDEKLTIGVNLALGTDYWHTFYHPQVLGDSRAVSFRFIGEVIDWPLPYDEPYTAEVRSSVRVADDEILNLFVFADLIYDARPLGLDASVAVEASGEARIVVDGQEVNERLAVTTTTAQRAQAFAYGALFNRPGPYDGGAGATVTFDEEVSVAAVRVVQTMIFGIAEHPTQQVEGMPAPAA